jgi:hypothetical protein
VIAVIEVKADIGGTGRLEQALENIKSVKILDRSNQGQNYILNGGRRGAQVDPEVFEHQVYGAIVTERSLSREVLRDGLLRFLQANPRRVWPNTYIDVHGPVAAYSNGSIRSDATGCTDLWLDESPQDSTRNAPPLIYLAQHLIDLFRVSPIVDFEPRAYVPLGRRFGDHWPISPDGIQG